MKLFGLLPLFGLILPSLGHYVVSNIYINDKEMPLGRCMRMPDNTDPLKDLSSKDIACNVNGDNGVARVCEIKAGDSVTFVWRSFPNAAQVGSIPAGSHDGPCFAYLKHFPDNKITTSAASGGNWFKIFEDGYSGGKWCSQKIRENGGKMTVRIPTDLKAGQYLLRGEHIALHDAKVVGGAQFYVGCAQVLISSAGQKTVPSYIGIPGHMSSSQVVYDFWNKRNQSPKSYKLPGNAEIFNPPANTSPIPTPLLKQSGFDDCTETNANWCGKPLPKFANANGCWSAAQKCWDQLTACYASAPISGNEGCVRYESLCEKAQDHCHGCSQSSCKPYNFIL